MADHDDAMSQFCDLTGASAQQATEYLTATDWDVNAAVASFYADQEEDVDEAGGSAAPAEPEYTGPRTLDGRPAPEYASSTSAGKKPQKRTGLATLSSLGGGHDNDDDDDMDDDDAEEGHGPRDLFAGGEKSGLAVHDPKMGGPSNNAQKIVKDIIAKAKANASRTDTDLPQAGPSRSSAFRSSGQTLGGEGAPSRDIPDPRGEPIAPQPSTRPNEPPQERVLHLWQDGFSIDDGELRRFDDPQNSQDLQMIRQGRAPLHLMNVRYDQPVDVKLQQHDENWRQLPRVYRPFSGEGRRLGSPVPGESVPSPSAATAAPPAPVAAAAAQPGPALAPAPAIDESQPTLMIRIQLPDGTRLPARFNASQTIDHVYQFVQRASTATQARPWVLATTFPNKDHADRSLILGEVPEFKKGGTAIVKWT